MKRLALLTIFFYVCTFAAPQRSQAVVPVALIAAAAIGTAMMSTSIGTYYAQNGVMPQYVTATTNAIASAADALFQPSYLAKGVYSLFTPSSLSTAADYYVGKAAAVGATVGNLIDYTKDLVGYDALKSVVASNTNPALGAVTSNNLWNPVGSVFAKGTQNYLINAGTWNKIYGGSVPDFKSQYLGNGYTTSTSGDNNLYIGISSTHASPTLVCMLTPGPDWLPNQKDIYGVGYQWSSPPTATTDPVTYPPAAPTINYPGLKTALASPGTAIATDVQKALKNMPAGQVIKSTAIPSTVSAADSAPPLTSAEIAQILKDNTASVARAAAEAAQAIAAANPTDAAAQIAAAQAALEAAKAAEAAAEAANQPEPQPEPSYPVPSTWYTKTCDLSQGLDSCINYQQVINASHAFQSTALYQFPNLILQCLGYVQGDGCEYPPKISIDLFTRFSAGPINIDLSPFESVVKVMKFFFSILCLVGTGKATMTLFE